MKTQPTHDRSGPKERERQLQWAIEHRNDFVPDGIHSLSYNYGRYVTEFPEPLDDDADLSSG